MKTDCSAKQVEFEGVGPRKLVASFDAEHITSDGGLALLHEVDRRFGLLRKFAACFTDHRASELIHHKVEELVRQRVFGIACGYEDLVDHAALREDPLLAAVVGKADPAQKLASPSTLNRLELTPADATAQARYRKVVYDAQAIERFFVDAFLEAHPKPLREVVLDLDATDDPIHGTQEGRFFHGYYGNYCYLPLYIFAGDFLLCAKLRTSDVDAAAGALEEVQRLVAHIRERWPTTRLVLRADSGFARDELMTWCEQNGVDYVFGLARNKRLEGMIAADLELVREVSREEREGAPTRAYRELRYQTRDSWTRERRVVAKAEWLGDKHNPRFVVTSFSEAQHLARALYEELYCARGDMENRIKEQQLGLFADRTSAHTMRANQLRLWFASVAYVLLNLLRHFGLKGSELERAQAGTLRLKLLKVAALVRVSVRRVVLSLSAAAPVRDLFARIAEQLRTVPAPS
ncbi:Transposase DDE domain group 1 [Stigmatella aurantiaca]|uniref:Transposase DDE domain group 1 n=1 Tax=Stigmatella aurantiaca TaxID=41 RepID=A0A1H8G3Q0_STIAU|nr:IS1380 family transposase [Stigmatella aurantiaca]SEN38626.1 Transposase DDE domain group 1 [Stigmatella aurantiaca]